MTTVLALLAACAVAVVYRSLSVSPIPMGGADLLGLALAAALAALLAGGLGDYIEARRLREPFNKKLFNALVLRNLVFAAVTGWFIGAAAVYVAGPYDMSYPAMVAQFASVAVLAGAVAYGELISRYRDTPGRLLAADPTVVYLCVNVAAGTTALVLVKEFGAVTTDKHKMVYEALLAGFGAIAFFRTSLFTIRVSGSDIGVGPSTLLKALLDSSDMMLNRWQALNRGAVVRAIMERVDFEKAKTALPTTCFTLMNEFPPAVQASVGEQIKKLADDPTMSKEAKAIILGIYMIQQVGTDVLDRSVKTLGKSIE